MFEISALTFKQTCSTGEEQHSDPYYSQPLYGNTTLSVIKDTKFKVDHRRALNAQVIYNDVRNVGERVRMTAGVPSV